MEIEELNEQNAKQMFEETLQHIANSLQDKDSNATIMIVGEDSLRNFLKGLELTDEQIEQAIANANSNANSNNSETNEQA